MLDQNDQSALAVVLYGPLRTVKDTASSLLRHVIGGKRASIFYFGPGHSDSPESNYRGSLDVFGSFKNNPKSGVSAVTLVDQAALNVYGDRLAAFHFHDEKPATFVAQAEAVVDRSEWLMQLNPYRMFSMFYNMEGGIKLMLDYERRHGRVFDEVIITRPDLAYFSPIRANVSAGEVHIPEGEGINTVGQPHMGNARVFFYKNVRTGDFVPGGPGVTFNDQFFWVQRGDLASFLSLRETLPAYLSDRVPPSPETIFYLHLVGRGGLKPVAHPEWAYEIHRQGAALIRNVADTPDINLVDRRHPAAVKMRRSQPVYFFLRDVRWLARKAIRKLVG